MHACGSEKEKGTKFLIIKRFLRSSTVSYASQLFLVPLTNRTAIRRVIQLRRKLKLQFGSRLADWRRSPVGHFHASVRKSYERRRNYDYCSAKRGNKSEAHRHKCIRRTRIYSYACIHLQYLSRSIKRQQTTLTFVCQAGRQTRLD